MALVRAAVLAPLTLLVPPALAQTWEMLPFFPQRSQTSARAVEFLRGNGPAADAPAADTLVWIGSYGAFLYNPSGAAGAAGDNGEWGAWHRLCSNGQCASPSDGLVTAAGTLVIGSQAGATAVARGTNRGRTWALDVNGDNRAAPFVAPGLPGLVSPDGTPTILAGSGGFDGYSFRSDGDGASGTWTGAGLAGGKIEAFGVVPPSPSLPNGRVLAGVQNGATYSDDGGATYATSTLFAFGRYIVYAFAFVPDPAHAYGGTAYAGAADLSRTPGPAAEVHRSDDGGGTWALAHRFTAAELDLPVFTGQNDVDVQVVSALYATPDGALWAGVDFSGGASNPARGGIARSVDGGATWARADAGFRDATGRGYRVNQFALGRDGVLYAATERGVWRTTGRAVAGGAVPAESPGVGVSVRPNPAGGRVEVVVSLADGGPVRVVVLDALGREVAVVWDGASPAGTHVLPVETGVWPAGVYVVRATAGGRVATGRLTVVR